jgi:D-alanyl-lipoteichoic acid acyltransferase DltB (MBOAT superfamily)
LAVPLLAMAGLGLVLGSLRRPSWRRAGILLVSLAAAYLLQPATPLRAASFWLPTAAVGLTVLVWAAVRPAQASWRQVLPTVAVLAGVVVLLALTRYLPQAGWLASLHPPPLGWVFAAGIAVALVASAASRPRIAPWLTAGLLAAILGTFIVLKSQPLLVAASAALRRVSGQSPELASPIDLVWLGFSYLAFRLLHVLLDQRAGRLPAISLSELVSYTLFFPALTAGPIDRVDRFVEDLRRAPDFGPDTLREGGTRIVVGLAKKFVVADTFAMIALQPLNADRVTSTGWLWILLYAFSFQLYFDFSGYTDVAIGVARLVGIRLPENFQRPYLQPNLTAFWNSWHMTLAQWFRAYVFNPMTRALRSARRPWPAAAIVLVGQLTTMVLIGLWHGIGWGFVIWGAWHGLGLFVQNRWSTWMRGKAGRWWSQPVARRVAAGAGILVTFHFVSLGWVWFTLTDPGQAGRIFLRLFGG